MEFRSFFVQLEEKDGPIPLFAFGPNSPHVLIHNAVDRSQANTTSFKFAFWMEALERLKEKTFVWVANYHRE